LTFPQYILLSGVTYCAGFESPWGGLEQSNNCIYWLFLVCDWVDSLIGPSGLLLVVFHLLIVPLTLSFMGGVGNKLVTKSWMWETCFAESHTESDGGDALITNYSIHFSPLYSFHYLLQACNLDGLFIYVL
jgi:hypothetical protein